MKHGNGKNLGIKQNNYHLHGEVLANFPNFGLISKIDPNEQCLASFLGLARTAGIQICIWSKQGTYYTNFLVWMDSSRIDIQSRGIIDHWSLPSHMFNVVLRFENEIDDKLTFYHIHNSYLVDSTFVYNILSLDEANLLIKTS